MVIARLPKSHLISLMLLLSVLTFWTPTRTFALEASFTPANDNPEDGGGPLPLSNSQRQSLLELDRSISSSPNPQETLEQVANANGLSPSELANILERNRMDMTMAQGGSAAAAAGGMASRSLPRQMLMLIASAFGTLLQNVIHLAKTRPKLASTALLSLLVVSWTLWEAPRTGIILSTSPRPLGLSSGHSSWLDPPTSYLLSHMETLSNDIVWSGPFASNQSQDEPSMLWNPNDDNDNHYPEKDTILVKKGTKQSSWSLCIVAQTTLSTDDLNTNHDNDDEFVLDVLYDATQKVLSSRRFSEFRFNNNNNDDDDDNSNALSFYSKPRFLTNKDDEDGENECAMLVVKSMGDFQRFGLQPLTLFQEEEKEDEDNEQEEEQAKGTWIVYRTLKGGHFDGDLCFFTRTVNSMLDGSDEEGDKDDNQSHGSGVVVGISLVIPKGGRKPKKALARNILSALLHSISQTIATEAKQTLSRQTQSTFYRQKANARAQQRRHSRAEEERRMEEMAMERKRRWKRRDNGGTTAYRPSGRRMQSPNNC